MRVAGRLSRGGRELRRRLRAGTLRERALGGLRAEGGGSDTEERDPGVARSDHRDGAGQCEVAVAARDLREPVASSRRRRGQPQLRQQLALGECRRERAEEERGGRDRALARTGPSRPASS